MQQQQHVAADRVRLAPAGPESSHNSLGNGRETEAKAGTRPPSSVMAAAVAAAAAAAAPAAAAAAPPPPRRPAVDVITCSAIIELLIVIIIGLWQRGDGDSPAALTGGGREPPAAAPPPPGVLTAFFCIKRDFGLAVFVAFSVLEIACGMVGKLRLRSRLVDWHASAAIAAHLLPLLAFGGVDDSVGGVSSSTDASGSFWPRHQFPACFLCAATGSRRGMAALFAWLCAKSWLKQVGACRDEPEREPC